MASYGERPCHDDLVLTSNSDHCGRKSELVTALCYTKEELLSLKPSEEGHPIEGTTPSVISEKQVSVTIKEEKLEEAMPDQAKGVAGGEPQAGLVDNDLTESVLEKKKKKKKSSGKNKKDTASGFEEYFADTPITPDEYAEEVNDIYNQSCSFVERMQQCIQRYRARRKMNSERSNIFSKYLVLGGVDAGVKAFGGGLDINTLENCTAAEIADIQATDHIRSGNGPLKFYNAGNPVNWVIDFEGVVKGFLSEKAPVVFGIHERDIKEYCGVIRNFLNYVLMHNVCEEYTMNVIAALKICNLAEKELQLTTEVSKLLPGDFNMAASTLYGGSYYGLCIENSYWEDGEPLFRPDDPAFHNRKIMGMTVAEADRVFKTGIAFAGTYEHFRQIMAMQCHVVKKEFRAMEVCEIVLPSEEMRRKLIGAKDKFGHTGFALGILKVKHWDNPNAQEEDVSDDGEEDSGNVNGSTDSAVDSIWLEENILEKCFIGMKMKATVRELSIGLKYIDEIMSVECSFYTYLETERLDRWREPVLSERPGPTVDDPEKNFADDVDCDDLV